MCEAAQDLRLRRGAACTGLRAETEHRRQPAHNPILAGRDVTEQPRHAS